MNNIKIDINALMIFLKKTGCDAESAETWAHALLDVKESTEKIFNQLLPEGLQTGSSQRDSIEVLWDIREELRHIEYHIQDVEGR